MATYRIEDYRKAGLPQEAERRMARIVELSSGLGYGAAEDRRNHKQFLEMIYKIKFDPKMETFTTPNAARSTNSVDPKRMIAYIKKIVSSINLKAFTGAHGPEIRYNGIPWEYGVALNPYSPEEVVVSAHTWKDAPKDDIKDMEEKVKRDTAKLVSKLNASGFSATPRFYSQTKVPIYILGEISAQHKGQNSVQSENTKACNTLRPYGSWRAASRGNVHVGDYVIHKAQYASFKDDEEKLDRNSERVAGVQAGGFWTDMSGTNELERYSDYYVFNAARVRNAVVAKALNARARNDKQFHTYLVPVLRKGVKDYVTIERVADEETAKKLVDVPSFRIIGVTVDETRPVKVAKNATALNFSPGDKVSIVDTDIRYGGDKGEVVRKDGFRYVVRLTSRQDKPEVYFQPNQLKAANAEDAQGHEHGSDGKFASKGGGSDDGDSYEDPKTKRMKERLAKMREKNEALRKEIDQRKAGLAQKKADTEKMRAEVMKANVEKWKAAQKSKNAVVQNALNAATARNFTPTSEFEVGDKVRFRDSVRSVPHDETYTVVKVSGKNITIKGGRDGGTSVEFANNLEPVFNAATARNADEYVLTIKYRGRTTPVSVKKFPQPYGRSRAMKYLFDGGWMSDNHTFEKDTDGEMVFVAANPTD